MDKKYILKFKIQKKVLSKKQVLATDIYMWLDKKLPFSQIMKIINQKGYQFIFETFSQLKKQRCRSKVGLFLYIVNQTKIVFK